MQLVWIILIGLVVGKLAMVLTPGSAPGALFMTITIGIVGSVCATHVGEFIGMYAADHSAALVVAATGAAGLLLLYRFLARK